MKENKNQINENSKNGLGSFFRTVSIQSEKTEGDPESVTYLALVESVRFVGKKLSIFPKPPYLKALMVTKFRGTNQEETRFARIPTMTPSEFDLVSIVYEPDSNHLVRICTAKTGEIIKLSERILDEEMIIKWSSETD